MSAEPGSVTGERPPHAQQPAWNVPVRREIPAAGPVREPQVRLRESELIDEGRDLLDLLACRREHVAMTALSESEKHGSELDQFACRAKCYENHFAMRRVSRVRASSARPRHMPIP